MRGASILIVVSLLALAPAALAAPQPAIYYLQDTDAGPTEAGEATTIPPGDNASTSQRAIAYSDADAPSALFDFPAASLERLRGSSIAGVWIGDAVAADANLSAALYIVAPNGSRTMIAHASHSLLLDEDDVPPAAAWLAPNASAEQAVLNVTGFVANATKEPPVMFGFGYIDRVVPSDYVLALGVFMEPGSSGIPLGIATLEYGSQAAPSFVLAPWYAPDPAPVNPPAMDDEETPEPVAEPPQETDEDPVVDDEMDAPDASDDESDAPEESSQKDTPMAGGLALLALALAALVLRRR